MTNTSGLAQMMLEFLARPTPVSGNPLASANAQTQMGAYTRSPPSFAEWFPPALQNVPAMRGPAGGPVPEAFPEGWERYLLRPTSAGKMT